MVRISWDEPAVFAQMDVYRATTPEFAQAELLAEKAAPTLPFEDHEVEPGVTYYYWAQAKNFSGGSPLAGPVQGHSASGIEVLWVPSDGGRIGLPTIGPDGTLYAIKNMNLVAVSGASGTVQWTFPGVASDATLAIAPNGWIICRTNADVFALNPEGELQWRAEGMLNEAGTWPAISEDGVIYWGFSNFLKAVTLKGEEVWTLELASRIGGAPAIQPDGMVCFTTHSGHLHAINPAGSELWALELEPPGRSSGAPVSGPIIGLDGTIFVMGNSGHVYAVHPDGSLLWKTPFYLHGTVHSECVIAPNGTVVAPGLTALASDGTEMWYARTVSSAAPLVSRDSIIFSPSQGALQARALDGTLLWEYQPPIDQLIPFQWVSSPVLTEDGTLYFTTSSGLVALKTPHQASADGWTQLRGNHQRTGRVSPTATHPSLTARFGDNPAVVVLEILSPAQGSLQIEYSQDLKTWKELRTIQTSSGAAMTEEPIQANRRFYRLVIE